MDSPESRVSGDRHLEEHFDDCRSDLLEYRFLVSQPGEVDHRDGESPLITLGKGGRSVPLARQKGVTATPLRFGA